MHKDSAEAKMSSKVVGGGATFLTHSVPRPPRSFLTVGAYDSER